jgi:hypothetical protein
MNAFDVSRRFELEMWRDHLSAYARGVAPVREDFMRAGTGDYHRNLGYDFAFVYPGKEIRVELKCERRHTGNLFLETWSNKAFSRARDGWMFTCKSDLLWYFFRDTLDLYAVDFPRLWEWAFGPPDRGGGNIYRHPERHTVCDQKNHTWGHCVPVNVLVAQCGMERVSLKTQTAVWESLF